MNVWIVSLSMAGAPPSSNRKRLEAFENRNEACDYVQRVARSCGVSEEVCVALIPFIEDHKHNHFEKRIGPLDIVIVGPS